MKSAANLKTLDVAVAGLREPFEWQEELAEAEQWTRGLAEPFDDAPDFDPATNPEVSLTARLSEDKAFTRRPTRRLFRDYRADPNAYRHIDPLPKAGQALHGVISGKYALWQLVPAVIERTGMKIKDLYLCTLSYSKSNAAELLGMLDDGQVKRVTLLVSHYFRSTSRDNYDALVPELLKRGHRVLAMRTHAKICLLEMSNRTRFVIESSANLRSCKNIEQFTLTRCPKLHRFHRTWLEDELFKPRNREAADVE